MPKQSGFHTASDSADSPIRIGYFEEIRCERSIDILTQLLTAGGRKVCLIIKGEWLQDDERRNVLRGHPDARINGPYRSPDGLAKVYGDVDFVWVGYPTGRTVV